MKISYILENLYRRTVTQLKHQNLLSLTPALKKIKKKTSLGRGHIPKGKEIKMKSIKIFDGCFSILCVHKPKQFMVTAVSRRLKNTSFLFILVTWVTWTFPFGYWHKGNFCLIQILHATWKNVLFHT